MRRIARGFWLALLCSGLVTQSAAAALEVAVSVSPSEGIVGRPVEVLVRTFTPIDAADLSLPVPSLEYPTASGIWNVLYPIADYPFDVVANPPMGATVRVTLTRDSHDASLWRGSFIPSSIGAWTIVLRNFPTIDPIHVEVIEAETSLPLVTFGAIAVLAGLLIGLILGRVPRRRPQPEERTTS
jgi:hypothetical protein